MQIGKSEKGNWYKIRRKRGEGTVLESPRVTKKGKEVLGLRGKN